MCNFGLLNSIVCILLFALLSKKHKSNTFLDFINDNSIKLNNYNINNNLNNDINNNENNDVNNNINNYTLNNSLNNISLEKQNEEYKDKINNLEKYVKELQSIIKEKDILINEVKGKNEDLNKKIKELEMQLNNAPNKNDFIEMENEIKLFKSYYKFLEDEKLIKINFISVSQDINYSIITKNTDNFSNLEVLLYKQYPKYLDSENYFIVNGNRINRNRTIKQNNIKNNDVITLLVNTFDE